MAKLTNMPIRITPMPCTERENQRNWQSLAHVLPEIIAAPVMNQQLQVMVQQLQQVVQLIQQITELGSVGVANSTCNSTGVCEPVSCIDFRRFRFFVAGEKATIEWNAEAELTPFPEDGYDESYDLPVSFEVTEDECPKVRAFIDVKNLPGFDQGKTQTLLFQDASWKMVDVGECEEEEE